MQTLESNIRVNPVSESRLQTVDMDNIPFGRVFSDHMLVARYVDGEWQQASIMPYGKLAIAPSVTGLNYGQSIFEGMKAFRSPLGEPLLFRPEDNFNRLNHSARRMCMPEVPEDIFLEGLYTLLRLDKQWLPSPEQGSLYIRPLMYGADEFIGVKASETYTFVIFTCPVGPYYAEPVSLLVMPEFIRAAVGGTGNAKAAGNYAGALLPDRLAKEKGYHNVLWLDARERAFIEECGTMNVFFVIDDTVITPPLNGTILPGITRHSVLTLLRDRGYKVEVRPLSIYEVQAAAREGHLQEAFGVGTAATISHVARIGFNGEDLVLPPSSERKVANWLNQELGEIKYGRADDPYGWVVKV